MERKVLIGMGVVLIIFILYSHNSTIRVNRHELEALSHQQSALLNKAGYIQNKRGNIQHAVVAFRSALQDLQNQVSSLSMEIQNLEKDMKAMEGGLQESQRTISGIQKTPFWDIYSTDIVVAIILLLSVLWLVYRWYMEHRQLRAGSAGHKVEFRVLEGQGKKSTAASADIRPQKKA
jgi:hypothetical protein